jgi:hypothetical protein
VADRLVLGSIGRKQSPSIISREGPDAYRIIDLEVVSRVRGILNRLNSGFLPGGMGGCDEIS